MKIDWTLGEIPGARCPACGDWERKPVTLSVPSALPPGQDLPLAVCQDCGTAFFPTLEAVAYEGLAGADEALGFYLEQGAGIDAMVEPVEGFVHERVRRYLEIGCGYGLSLDYSRAMFGWEVRGVDPGFGARAGKRELGLDIIEGYLTSPDDAAPLPYDVVMCSEVLEHVFDPEGFLSVVRQTLAPDGTLVLTTPNAALIAAETPAGTLIPLLSPGYHVTLYSRAGLEILLRRIGFTSVSVVERGPTLRAAASMVPLKADLNRPLDRSRYIAYLERRSTEIPAASPLALGFRYRQFKELVHAGEYGRAEEAERRVADLCRLRWGRDFADLGDAAVAAPPVDLRAFHALYPFCIAGILYFRSMLAWRRGHDAGSVRKGFHAAAAVGERLRAVLLAIGADDGETEELVWRALGHAAHAVAATDPETAIREAEQFGRTPSPILSELMPAPIAAEMRRAIFVTLVNLGHGTKATLLADSIASEIPDDGKGAASVSFALGIFALNHADDPQRAAEWFGKAHLASKSVAEREPEAAEALLWPSLYHEALALIRAGERRIAEVKLQDLASPTHPGLPDVTPDLRCQVVDLAKQYNLSL